MPLYTANYDNSELQSNYEDNYDSFGEKMERLTQELAFDDYDDFDEFVEAVNEFNAEIQEHVRTNGFQGFDMDQAFSDFGKKFKANREKRKANRTKRKETKNVRKDKRMDKKFTMKQQRTENRKNLFGKALDIGGGLAGKFLDKKTGKSPKENVGEQVDDKGLIGENDNTQAPKSNTGLYIGIGLGALVLIGLIIYFVMKNKKQGA